VADARGQPVSLRNFYNRILIASVQHPVGLALSEVWWQCKHYSSSSAPGISVLDCLDRHCDLPVALHYVKQDSIDSDTFKNKNSTKRTKIQS
jgi:hypothetical protein